jgi:hypothetical protein
MSCPLLTAPILPAAAALGAGVAARRPDDGLGRRPVLIGRLGTGPRAGLALVFPLIMVLQ